MNINIVEHIHADTNAPSDSDPIFSGIAPCQSAPIPLFGDAVWPLEFLNANPSTSVSAIYWDQFPPAFRYHLKLAAWALMNVPFPDEVRQACAQGVRSVLAASSIYVTIMRWRLLAEWLQQRGIECFADLTTVKMDEYVTDLGTKRVLSRSAVSADMTAILRLWVIGHQFPGLSLGGEPPWLRSNHEAFLPKSGARTGDNVTEPISPVTMSSLLDYAMSTIETCSEAILEADRFSRIASDQAKEQRRRDGSTRLNKYLDKLKTSNKPLPAKLINKKYYIDCVYIACANHVTLSTVHNWAAKQETKRYFASHHEEAYLTLRLPPEGLRILPEKVRLDELPILVGLLETACFIVVAYLTGMRTGEVLALEVDSLRHSSHGGGWMLLYSRHFKTVRDRNGNHDSRGEVRNNPWVAVAPVVRAIRTMEELREKEGGLLFPTAWKLKRAEEVRSRSSQAISEGIERFMDYINDRRAGAIEADPYGRITATRFRRTLAWHIAFQPRGLVALAIQYGHLRTAVSEGYAGRTRNGLLDLVDFETARSIALGLAKAHEEIREGEGVSGPAAARFVTAVQEQREQYGGIITSQKQATSLLRDQRMTVFQNDEAFVWCNFRRESALCMSAADSDSSTTPRLDKCRPSCGNIARTDRQVALMRVEAARLQEYAASMPRPAAERLQAHADSMSAYADRHDAERSTPGNFNAS